MASKTIAQVPRPGLIIAFTVALSGVVAWIATWTLYGASVDLRRGEMTCRAQCAAELAAAAPPDAGGGGCPPKTVPLDGGCWIRTEVAPPCPGPAVEKQGRCWVRYAAPAPATAVRPR